MASIKKVIYGVIHTLCRLVPRDHKLFIFIGWHKKKGGEVFADNAKYFFLFVSQHHPEIHSIWIAKSRVLAKKLRDHGYRSYYEKSMLGIWYQLRAGFFVIDAFLQPLSYMLSGRSKIIQLLHGKGMKKKGYAERQDKVQDFIFNTSPFTESILPEIFKKGSETFITGYPRNDIFFKDIKNAEIDTDAKMVDYIRTIKSHKKIIMYAPTFRRGQKEFNFDSVLPLQDLENFAKEHNLFFILSLHNKYRSQQEASEIKEGLGFLIESDIYPLLKHVDLLITDYSSSFADYLLLDRPIIFYPYDFDEYNKKEGLTADYNEITPGIKVFNYEELKKALKKALHDNDYSNERLRVRNLYHSHTDGNSSERIWRIIEKEI